MKSVKPVYLVALVAVSALALVLQFINPHKKYSTREFWQAAEVSAVQEVPQEALNKGNRNGPVLMWAAMGSSSPEVIRGLVARGADVNESDRLFAGTPLTGAAGYSRHPEIIEELVRLGADANKKVHNDETALMVAARYNKNAGIVEALVNAGAETDHRNSQGLTALELAIENENDVVAEALKRL